jgi:hypothetical protein
MEELQQLVKLIERKGRLPGSHLLNFTDEESLETKLYFYLKENKNCEEEDVIEYLYKSKDKKNAFKMLKSRFKKKLFNQLLYLNFLPPESETTLLKTELLCSKLLLETNILLKSEFSHLAEKQIIKVLRLARETHLTKQIIEALEQYIAIAAYLNLSDKILILKSELEEQYEILDKERKANIIFRLSLNAYKGGIISREQNLNALKENVEILETLWEESKNSFIYPKYRYLKMMYFEYTGNYSEQIKFLNKIKQAFKNGFIHPLYYNNKFNLFVHTYACLRCKMYDEGQKVAHEMNQISIPGTHNWFAHNENYFMLAVHSKNYIKAKDVLISVITDTSFKNMDLQMRERWSIHLRLFQLLIGEIIYPLIPKNTRELIQDKKGFNIWVIILEFLTLLKDEEYDVLSIEAERIRKYMSKHLDSKSDPRNKYFLKLLLLVVKEEFDLEKCRQKSRYLYNKLSQTPPAGDAYAEVEVVPFEHLWDFILETLSKNKANVVKY